MLEYSLKIALRLSAVLCAIFFSLFAFASETNELSIGKRAIETALKLELASEKQTNNSNLELTPNIRSLNEHQYSRIEIWNGFDSSSDSSFLDSILEYEIFAKNSRDPQDIALANLFVDLSKIYNPYSEENSSQIEEAMTFLENHLDSEFWTVKHSASIILSVLSSYQRDIPMALELATESFWSIPEEELFEAQVSRFYSYGLTTYLHGVLKNPDMYLSSIEGLIASSTKIGHPIETVNHLNNLIYSMRNVEDKEVARRLVDILLRVSKGQPSDTPGLVEMRSANALIRIGDFKRALHLARVGQEKANMDRIFDILKIAEIQSLAATGAQTQAGKELIVFENRISNDEADIEYFKSDIFKARGLISLAEGDTKSTFDFMYQYAQSSIRNLLKSNNTDTSNLIANLENDKARQAEREAAREDLYRLEQDALEARIKSSQRGLVILFMLAVAAMLMAAFSAYRSRTAIKLAVAAEAALAGEKAKTQFLAVISHELRTPLNGIIGIADLLSRTAPTDDLRHKVSIINNSGQDLLRLVEQILDMSRIDANELEVFPENVDIRDVINGVDALWRPTIETKDVVFTSHVDKSVPKYLAIDPLRLRQCVNNLVSNAAKFTSQGRVHMHVIAGPSEADDTTRLKVIVADTGLGIRPDVQSNLFRPFVQADSSITRQYGGSGLGLAITRNLARLMGGDLTVTSRQGAGSEFTLTFTAKHIADTELLNTMDEIFLEIEDDISANTQNDTVLPAQAPQQTAKAPEVTKIAISPDDQDTLTEQNLAKPDFDNLSGVRILIVEDIPSNQDVMKIFLEPKGCVIMCANDGVQALKALKSQDFDVVLMDIRMPEMDGIEATRIVRNDGSRNAHVPIIALTADATAETNAQCMAAGANIFLTKPIIALELYDSIRFVRRQAYNRLETKLDTQTLAPAMPRRSA